jgi:hypothetical protein
MKGIIEHHSNELTVCDSFLFNCPGCKVPHSINFNVKKGSVLNWEFNRDVDNPSISPSILVCWQMIAPKKDRVCHSYVKEGKIQFLSDCTHSLAGQTVELPEYE